MRQIYKVQRDLTFVYPAIIGIDVFLGIFAVIGFLLDFFTSDSVFKKRISLDGKKPQAQVNVSKKEGPDEVEEKYEPVGDNSQEVALYTPANLDFSAYFILNLVSFNKFTCFLFRDG